MEAYYDEKVLCGFNGICVLLLSNAILPGIFMQNNCRAIYLCTKMYGKQTLYTDIKQNDKQESK